MKKFILILIILAAVGGWFYLRPKPDRSSITPSRPQSTQTSQVTYTDSGYSPANLAVKVGATVMFKNESGSLMWTASNLHPTHTILPEFDPLQGVGAGQSYSFTFTKLGTWPYHNHLKPSHSGSVTVE